MFHDGGFIGMHLLWWVFWIVLLVVMFGWFEPVPKKRIRKDSPFDILQKRLASGDITNEEYAEKKRIIENDLAKSPITGPLDPDVSSRI